MPETSNLERIVSVFLRHQVEFIIIGGQAETLMGSPRVTYDTDLCYRRSESNLERLANALSEIKPSLRGAPADLPFTIDARALALGSNFTLSTPAGDLDLIGWVEPLGAYEALIKNSETYEVCGTHVRSIGLDDLIRIKQHISRPKDRDSLFQLLAIKNLRNEGSAS